MPHRVIHLHAEAPPKPGVGQACNGCGVCCALEPCPIGIVLSLRRRGRCRGLRWDDDARRYRCGPLAAALRLGSGPARWVARRIAAGQGCDAAVDATPAP